MLSCFRLLLLSLTGCLVGFSLQAQSPAPALEIAHTLEGHKELVYAVTFSPDGKHLISGSFDKTLKLWDVASAKEVKSYGGPNGHTDLVLSTAISPDGRVIASAAKDNSIKLWDMPISGVYRTYAGADSPPLCQALTPDGTRLIAGLENGIIKIWNTSDGQETAALPGSAAIHALAISAHGQWLAAGDSKGQVTLYRLRDNKRLASWTAQGGAVQGLGFHPNHQLIFTAGADGKVHVWNVPVPENKPAASPTPASKTPAKDDEKKTPEKTTPEKKAEEKKASDQVDEGDRPLGEQDPEKKETTKDDKNEKVPEKTPPPAEQKKPEEPKKPEAAATAQPVRSIDASPSAITGSAIIEGGNRAIVTNQDGVIRILNLTNGKIDKEIQGQKDNTRTLAVTPNSQLIFTSGADKQLRCYNISEGKELKVLPCQAEVQSLFATDKLLLVGYADGSLAILNIAHTANQALPESFGKPLHQFKQPAAIRHLLMGANEGLFYAASSDKSITSYKLASDTPIRNLGGHGNLVDAAHFSPDGLTIASCSHDGTIRFWNLADGKQTGEVKLAAQPLYCLAWRPDGKQIAVGSFDRTIRLINVASRKVEREIPGYDDKSSPQGHQDAVYSVVYASNEQLYSAGADGKIKLWNVADGAPIKALTDPALPEKAQRDFINTIKLTSDGQKLVSVGNGGWITLWNTAEGKLLHSQKLPVGLYGLSISPDNTRIATGNMNGTVYLLKMP